MVGRQFEEADQICSLITKKSISALKENFADELSKDDIKCALKLKKVFGIP